MQNQSQQIKSFWEKDGGDYHAQVGTLYRAVTIVPYIESNGKYGISTRSYFPFTKEQYSKRFDKIYDATIYAESILLDFVKSIFEMTQQKHSNYLDEKQPELEELNQ